MITFLKRLIYSDDMLRMSSDPIFFGFDRKTIGFSRKKVIKKKLENRIKNRL